MTEGMDAIIPIPADVPMIPAAICKEAVVPADMEDARRVGRPI